MAEIRKFDPDAGNAIAQALHAAMGEPIRPRVPGGAESQTDAVETPATPPSVVTVRFTTRSAPSEDDPTDD
ncbi:MAG: hypothetical protein K4304_09610 [Propionicimonas sp.]|jgi:hypothetical protein